MEQWIQIISTSPPSRAAWIEIMARGYVSKKLLGRRLHGRRGLKYRNNYKRGKAGKSPPSRAAWIEILHLLGNDIPEESPPSRAAWIEIINIFYNCNVNKSPPSRAAWIEIATAWRRLTALPSPPSRAAWIEINRGIYNRMGKIVAAFTGGVD